MSSDINLAINTYTPSNEISQCAAHTRDDLVSREESSREETEAIWYGPLEPENQIPLSRLIVTIITVALILVLAGAPYYNPLTFMIILVFVFGFGMICAYMNQELVRGLRGK